MNETLFAFYDLAVSPVSFDFSSFLVCADVHRRQRNLKTIHFVVVPVARGPGHWDNELHADDHLAWRINNVVIPLSELVPASAGLTISPSRDEAARLQSVIPPQNVFPETYSTDAPVERHHTGWTVILAHLGENLQCVSASQQARRYARQWIEARSAGRKCIALTLREASFGPQRNADPVAWGAFARKLQKTGHFPVVLRDIDTALGPPHPAFEGIATFPEGVFNLDLRMALYEEAYIHASVANGPCHTCFYDRAVQYLYFVTGDWLTAKPTPFGRIGVEFGEQPPFANRYQRWIWKEQDPEMMMAEFLELDGLIDRDRRSGEFQAGLDPVAERRMPMSALCTRFEQWARRSYWTAPEELRLTLACRSLDTGRVSTDRERLETLVAIALCRNDTAKAAALLRSLGEKFGYTPEIYAQLGIVTEGLGDYLEAARLYCKVLELQGGMLEIVFRLGMVSRKLGNLARARQCFEALVNRGSTYGELFRALGEVYEAMDEPERARAVYARMPQ